MKWKESSHEHEAPTPGKGLHWKYFVCLSEDEHTLGHKIVLQLMWKWVKMKANKGMYMNINFSGNYCGNKIWIITWMWRLRKPDWELYWRDKVCLSKCKLELEDELEHEHKHEARLVLQLIWKWVNMNLNLNFNINIYLVVNYSCNQCGHDRQVESELSHECETTRSPGGAWLQKIDFTWVVWGCPTWSEMVPVEVRWSQVVSD